VRTDALQTSEARAQALRRALIFLAALAAAIVVGTLLLLPVLDALAPGLLAEEDWERAPGWLFATTIWMSLVVLVVADCFVRRDERLSWRSLFPPQRAGADLLLGAVFALAPLLAFAGIHGALGWLVPAPATGAGSLTRLPPEPVGVAAPALLVAVMLPVIAVQSAAEEVVCRGYLLHQLRIWRGAWPALILTSLLFGVLHGLNPAVTGLALAGTAVVGLMMGLLVFWRSLWAAVGYHCAWNFALAALLGQPVSGLRLPSWFPTRATGPELWTGGEFGPEGGLTVLGLSALEVLLVWAVLARRRGGG